MTMQLRTLVLCALLVSACGGEDGDEGSAGAIEDFADAPESVDSALRLDVPDWEAPPASDTMRCFFLEPTTEDIYVDKLEVYQGRGGHHIAIMRTIMREEPGTSRGCSKGAEMINILPVMPSSEFVPELPRGMAIRVPKGSQLVVQHHYLNTSTEPAMTNGRAFLRKVAEDDVATLVGFLAVNKEKFSLAPKPGEQTVSIDCEVPEDGMNIMLLGPHMHEYGKSYESYLTPVGGEKMPLVMDDAWTADKRDAPPYQEFDDLVLNHGDRVQVDCHFENTSDDVLEFPVEMCTLYGLYYPADTMPIWICSQ